MSEIKFKKGDRVVVARPDEEDIKMGIKKGDKGEILQDNDLAPWVRMDKFNDKLGNAADRCEKGHGWGFYEHQLELEPKSEVSNEEVNSPNHYNATSVEVWEMMLAIWGKEKFIAFCEMNAFKYRMRLGLKDANSPLIDLDKAKWYEGKAADLRNENTEEE